MWCIRRSTRSSTIRTMQSEPHICVIARRVDHDDWRKIFGDLAHYTAPMHPLYGMRFDLIVDDVGVNVPDEWHEQYQLWFDTAVRCRLAPNGKII